MATTVNPIAGAGEGQGTGPNPEVELVEGQEPPVSSGQEPGSTPEGQQPEGQQPQGEPTDAREDGRSIPHKIRALKDTNPEAYKIAKDQHFQLQGYRQVHPTVQDARKEHDLIQSLGGPDSIASMKENAAFFRDAAQQFLKGDPAFANDLWEEDAIAAALHVVPMLENYAKHDPEGYSAMRARFWDKEFQEVGFGQALGSVINAIKNKNYDEALRILGGPKDSFLTWYNQIETVAKRAEDPRVKTLLAERTKRQESEATAQKEESLKQYRTETVNDIGDAAARIFDSYFKGKKVDPEDRIDLIREAVGIANRAVLTDKQFATDRDEHLRRGDIHSARQLSKARFERELPDAVKRVARRYGNISGQPPNTGGQQRQQTQGQQPPKVEQGFIAVKERPAPEQIDRARTAALAYGDYSAAIMAGKAVLRDGKKVDWSALRKAALT